MMFTRQCPSCNSVLEYTEKCTRDYFAKKESLCNPCRGKAQRKYEVPEVLEMRCKCGHIRHFDSRGTYVNKLMRLRKSGKVEYECLSCSHYTRHNTSRIKLRNCPSCNKQIRYSHERTLQRAIKRNAKCASCANAGKPMFYNYNEECCDYLDIMNEFWEGKAYFRHQLNNKNGEFTFKKWHADGYDEQNNIWFEWDEAKHTLPYMRRKDSERAFSIISGLNCSFLRYDTVNKELYQIYGDGTKRHIFSN